MDALELSSRHRQIAGSLGATCKDHGIKFCEYLAWLNTGRAGIADPFSSRSDDVIHQKLHALGAHLLDAAIDMGFFHFEIRNPVPQQPSHTVILFENNHIVTRS